MNAQLAEIRTSAPLTPLPSSLSRDLLARIPVRATAIATGVDTDNPHLRTVVVRFDSPETPVNPNDWDLPEDVALWVGEASVVLGVQGAFDDAIARYLDLWGNL